MKKFRVEVFFGTKSFHRVVEAKTNMEAILKTMNDYKRNNDPKEYWPMRAIEL